MLKYNLQQIKLNINPGIGDRSPLAGTGIDKVVDEIRKALEFIQEQALGKAIELSATPTATEPLLSDGEWGVYNDKLYFRVGVKIYEITPSTTITIT